MRGARRGVLELGTAFYGYPGGMAFHTSFHGGITTRYLILKTATERPALHDYLDFNDRQIATVSELRPVEVDRIQKDDADAFSDPTAEPDEHREDLDSFRFFSDDQLSRLDLLALFFDGYPAFARSSVAERLELSPMIRSAIARILAVNRTESFLLRLRANFADQLPSDQDYRDSVFAGKFLAHLNHQIAAVLKSREAKRLAEWIGSAPPSDEAIEAMIATTPLPGGLNSLAARWNPLRQDREDEE